MSSTLTHSATTPTSEARHAGRGTLAVAFVFTLQLACWLLLYRWLLFTGDDFLHTGAPRRLHGQMTAGEILQSYMRDYTQINGRAADAVARVVMQSGVTGWQIAGPVVITVTSAIAYLLIRGDTTRRSTVSRVWLAVTTAGVPLMLLTLRPALGGQVYFWISAAVGYLVGTLLLLAAGSFYLVAHRSTPSTPVLAGAATLMVITHLFHETASVGLLLMGVVFWVYHPFRQVDRRILWVSIASLAGFLANLLSPGSLARLLMATGSETPDAVGLPERIVRGATMLLTLVWPALLIIAVAAGLIALRRRSVTGWALTGVGAAAGALGAGRALRGVSVRDVQGVDLLGPWLLAGFLALAAMLVLTERQAVQYTTVHLLAGTAGCAAIPVVMGTLERGHFPAATLAYFTALSLLSDAVRSVDGARETGRAGGRTRAVVLAAVAVPIVVVLPFTALHTYRATKANHDVWAVTERQIDDAVHGRRSTVEFPDARHMPAPEYVYSNAYLMRRYEPMIRSYYGLGADVKVTVRRGGTGAAPDGRPRVEAPGSERGTGLEWAG